MRRRALWIATLALLGACGGKPDRKKDEKLTTQRGALTAPGPQPLFLGTPTSGLWMFSGQNSNNLNRAFPAGSDLAAANLDADGQAELLLGIAGGGLFAADIPIGQGLFTLNAFSPGDVVASGDLHGDGQDELFWANVSSGTVFGFSSTGTLSNFFGTNPVFGGAAVEMVVCDLNRDGKDELVVLPSPRGIYSADPNVSFDGFLPPFPFTAGTDKIACADLNGDNYDDLIIAHPGPLSPSGTPTGPGSFQVITDPSRPPVDFFNNRSIAFTATSQIVAGDLDGDGFAEVVIGRDTSSSGASSSIIQIFSAPSKVAPTSPAQAFFFGNGSKLAIPRARRDFSATEFRLPFVVQSLLYAPPGASSEVEYAEGNTIGSRTEWTSINTVSGQINGTISNKGGTASFGVRQDISTSTIETGAVYSLKTVESILGIGELTSDTPDHNLDRYYIVFGPIVTRTDFNDGNPRYDVDMSEGLPRVILAGWLNDPSTMPEGIRQDINQKLGRDLTPDERQEILALNPFMTGEPIAQNPDRFIRAEQSPLRLECCGTITGMQEITINGTEAGTGVGFSTETAVSASLTPIPAGVGVGGEVSFRMEYQKITSAVSETSLSASIRLLTPNCVDGDVAVYMDLAFGTYVTIPTLRDTCQSQPMQTLSFESIGSWQVQNGSSTLSTDFLHGRNALSISSGGWTSLVSQPLSSALLRQAARSPDLSKMSYALRIPTTQPNPHWIGASQLYITAPSANVYNAYMGQVELTPLPRGQYVRLNFTVPPEALHVITGDREDVTFTIVLNVNAGTSGWLLDDLQIGN